MNAGDPAAPSPHPKGDGIPTGRQVTHIPIWVAAILGGIVAVCILHLLRVNPAEVVGVVLFLVITATLTPLIRSMLTGAWQSLEGRRRVWWLAAAAATGLLLTLAIPIDLSAPSEATSSQTLEVVATGKSNPASVGSEVWIFEVTADGDTIPLADFTRHGSWQLQGTALVSPAQSSPDSVTWTGEVSRDLAVVLLAHQYSGIAELSWAGTTQQIDLYDAVGTQRIVILQEPTLLAPAPRLGIVVAFGLAFGLIVFVLSVWLVTRRGNRAVRAEERAEEVERSSTDPAGPTRRAWREPWKAETSRPVGRYAWVALAIPPFAAWSIYLLALWPGVLTVDSIDQWTQLVSGSYNDWHPAFHSLTEWVLTRLVESPAMVAGTQVAVLSGVVGWALASMRRLGLTPGLAWLISFAVALWPANGITVITLWKDVPYTIGVLALGVIILREVDGRQSLLARRGGWVLLGGVAALVVLYHHAGVAIAAGSLLALGLAVRRRAVIGAALLALVVVVLVQGGLYRAVGVAGLAHPGIDAKVIQHIGAHVVNGTSLTAEERAQIADLIPIPGTAWFDCQTFVPLIVDPRFSVEAMHERSGEARALWWSLFLRDPVVDLEQVACTSSFVWRIRLLPRAYRYNTGVSIDGNGIVSTISGNGFGLELEPVLPGLTGPLARAIAKSQSPKAAWLWWRGALYLYLLLIGAAIAALRSRDWRYWTVVVPAGLVAAVLIVIAPAHDFRFMWPVALSGMVLAPFLVFAVERRETRVPAAGGDRRREPARS